MTMAQKIRVMHEMLQKNRTWPERAKRMQKEAVKSIQNRNNN